MPTLLMSSRHSEDSQLLWRAGVRRGWNIVRARGLSIPEFEDNDVALYVEALFAPPIAALLGLELLDPPEDWLAKLPVALTRRSIRLTNLREARTLSAPAFVKPPNDKSFTAKVYNRGEELSDAFEDDMAVLISTPVIWECEFRCFCLDGRVLAHSPYIRNGALSKFTEYRMSDEESQSAVHTAEQALDLKDIGLPRAIVIDVGRIKGKGWAVVEANGAWGAGVYGCNPDKVLDVVRCATVPA